MIAEINSSDKEMVFGLLSGGSNDLTKYVLFNKQQKLSDNESMNRKTPIVLIVCASLLFIGTGDVNAQSNFVFAKTLRRGYSGEEVRRLQEFLKTMPYIYPEGLVTGYFGLLTEKAVQRFQTKFQIVSTGSPVTTGYGLIGPKTRAKLNELTSSPPPKPIFSSMNQGTTKTERKINTEKCPDNIWDEAEQKDPTLCPEDNPANNPKSVAAKIVPQASLIPQVSTSTPDAQASKPVSIPPSLENSCVGFKIKRTDIMTTATQIGAGWVTMANAFRWDMVEPEKGVYDFARADEIIKKAQENNTALLVEIVPYAKWDQGSDASCAGKPNEYMCKPKDMPAYKKALSATIERYDGDGQKDMPGMKFPIKYWQIINEADIKDQPYVIFFVGGPGDYLEVLKESYGTIKEACSDCKVLVGAAASVQSEAISFWGNVFDLGGTNYFDIANVHYVGLDVAGGGTVSLGDAATLNVGPYKNLLESRGIKKPIWVSEAVLQSSNARSWLQGALSAGASKVFFVGFGVAESAPIGEYSTDYKGIAELCPKIP